MGAGPGGGEGESMGAAPEGEEGESMGAGSVLI